MLCITNCFSMWSDGYLTRNLRTEGKIFILFCTKIHKIMLASVPAFVHCVDTIDLLVYPGNIWCLASPKHHHANINCTLQCDCNAGIILSQVGKLRQRAPVVWSALSLLHCCSQDFRTSASAPTASAERSTLTQVCASCKIRREKPLSKEERSQ